MFEVHLMDWIRYSIEITAVLWTAVRVGRKYSQSTQDLSKLTQLAEGMRQEAETIRKDVQVALDSHRSVMDERFKALASSVDVKVNSMRDGMAESMVSVKNDIASIIKKVEKFDDTFVRKDVHDAKMQVVEGKIQSVKEEITRTKRARRTK